MVDDYFVREDGVIWACARGLSGIDLQYYLNHSAQPNMVAREGGSWFETARAIEADEELTVDYATFNDSPASASTSP
jgi:SET domain-containing protein